jgi:hypothetical protein
MGIGLSSAPVSKSTTSPLSSDTRDLIAAPEFASERGPARPLLLKLFSWRARSAGWVLSTSELPQSGEGKNAERGDEKARETETHRDILSGWQDLILRPLEGFSPLRVLTGCLANSRIPWYGQGPSGSLPPILAGRFRTSQGNREG